MPPELTITYPDGHSAPFLVERARVRIGRALDNDLVLNNERISRYHAELLTSEGSLEIIDKTSANGIRVDGFQPQPEQPVLLNQGSEVLIGGFRITVVRLSGDTRPSQAPVIPAEAASTTPRVAEARNAPQDYAPAPQPEQQADPAYQGNRI